MYNIHSHYQYIFESLKTIVKHRRLLYLLPYGSSSSDNIELMSDNVAQFGGSIDEGPLFIFFDQEPIHDNNYNYALFDYIKNNFQPPFILVSTERNSKPLDIIQKKYKWPIVYYFHHIFAAHDWFRGYQFHAGLVSPDKRTLEKKFITFNRITGNSRVYRSLFVAELQKRKLLEHGYVSYSKNCPVHGSYIENLKDAASRYNLSIDYINESVNQLSSISSNLRIDQLSEFIDNDSQTVGPVHHLMKSFVYVVTETCFWEEKCHLTEKIFKPIVAKQPFLLLGAANNLSYLKSYGFQTFDRWWDESYDQISDPIQRIDAVVDILEHICSLSFDELAAMLKNMSSVLEYNYNHFYSQTFLEQAWQELVVNLEGAVAQLPRPTFSKN